MYFSLTLVLGALILLVWGLRGGPGCAREGLRLGRFLWGLGIVGHCGTLVPREYRERGLCSQLS